MNYYPEKELTNQIIGAAIEVHKYWGPGLLESVYEKRVLNVMFFNPLRKLRSNLSHSVPLCLCGKILIRRKL